MKLKYRTGGRRKRYVAYHSTTTQTLKKTITTTTTRTEGKKLYNQFPVKRMKHEQTDTGKQQDLVKSDHVSY